ncbi:glycoside hydrolase family 97 C-terminal domain-containing protein [Flagellimonas sp.]|uniref:glycoside hydrolase family 97 C-terminal domain-containing protein n=1 Tax=Flagellimonas sp. TaxID=2058762 RepID=UPI003BB20371
MSLIGLRNSHFSTDQFDYEIIFRCYNDGFAYRCVFDNQTEGELNISGENTKLSLADDVTFPAYNLENAFIDMISDPLNYINGWFDLNNAHSRVRVNEEIPGTVTAEVAKLILVQAEWVVLPDVPEEYLKNDDLFDCIRKKPAQFDSFTVLQGEIDTYITVARELGDDWCIGSLTNRDGRALEISLDFLPQGENYKVTMYSDDANTHFLNQKEAYVIAKQEVNNTSSITVNLALGSKSTIHLKKYSQGINKVL